MGKRINDPSLSEQTSFSPSLRVLVDKMNADPGADWLQAKNMQLKYLGNTYFQGSLNGIDWVDSVGIGHTLFRFSINGGNFWTTLSTNIVSEGVNQYFTEQRVLNVAGISDSLTNSHTHSNKSLLDNLISNGDGSSFLTDAGTYFNMLGSTTENYVPVKGPVGYLDSNIFKDGTSIKIGVAQHNIEFEADGTIKFNGNATVYDDVTHDALEIQQTGPGVTRNISESSVDFSITANQNDYLMVNLQMPHARKNGAVIYPHIHFWQAENNIPNFALQYRWQLFGGSKTVGWTSLKCNTPAFTYTSGTLNQIVHPIAGITPPVGDDVSDVVQFRILRDTANQLGLSFTADPYTTAVSVLQFDCHIEMDGIGSRTEYTK